MTEPAVPQTPVPDVPVPGAHGGVAVRRWLRMAGGVVGRALDRANGPQLVSWPVFWPTLVVGVVVHLLGSPDLPSGYVLPRIVAAVAGNVALFAVLAASAPLRRRPGAAGRVWLLVALVVGGGARGVVLQVLLFALGVTTSTNVAYRLPAGIATSAFTAAIMSAIIGAMRERAARLATAQAAQDGLIAAIRALDIGVEARQEQAAERIVTDLRRQLDLAFGADAGLDGRLRDLADDVVRPLSHALAETVPVPADFVVVREVAQVRVSDAWRGLRAVDGLRPMWLTVIPAVLTAPAVVAFVEPGQVARFVVAGIVSLAAATLVMRGVVTAVTTGRPSVVQAVALTVALLVVVSVGIAVIVASGTIAPQRTEILYTAYVFIPTIGWTLAITASVRRAIDDADARIAADTARLRWASARLAAIRWQQQGDLSRALHGPVQAAIHAAVSQIGRADADGDDLGPVIAQQRDLLTDAIMRLALPQPQPLDIDGTLAVATSAWAGIATVDVAIEPAARAALHADPVSAGVFVDVVVEAVSNAVRHGQATQVSIGVTTAGPDLAELVIRDNGRGAHDLPAQADAGANVAALTSGGLGIELMRQCSVELEQRVEADGYVVRALFPVQRG